MPTLKITDLRVWNQRGEDATLFNPFQDAISLAVGVDISADLTANLDVRYQVAFQIIEATTNTVVVNSNQTYMLPEDWPRWWFTAGNNWSDFTTAEGWGIPLLSFPRVYGFRAILTAVVYVSPEGYQKFDTFDVSTVRWFQLMDTSKLD
jgi:hypothetical protein